MCHSDSLGERGFSVLSFLSPQGRAFCISPFGGFRHHPLVANWKGASFWCSDVSRGNIGPVRNDRRVSGMKLLGVP